MRNALLILFFVLIADPVFAQQDYFVAESLIDAGKHTEAIQVLDALIDSNAYVGRPRMHMMTLNLAGTTKKILGDSAGAKSAFRAAIAYYDTVRIPYRQDDFVKREKYIACRELASLEYRDGHYNTALTVLNKSGPPGEYYSATGHDVLVACDSYYSLRAKIFQELEQPDSAFRCLLEIREHEDLKNLELRLRNPNLQITHVEGMFFDRYTMNAEVPENYGYLYVATLLETSTHTHETVWITNYALGKTEILNQSSAGNNASGFPFTAFDLALSFDQVYLAVQCEAEGTTWIDVISFSTLINEKRYETMHSIAPYPGLVSIKFWEDNQLVITSDIDLLKLNRKDSLSTQDLFGTIEDKKDFLFDPVEKKFARK